LRVGIFGGTFNPPHFGHLRLAEEVVETHNLELVVFMPCHIPPHKESNAMEIAPAEDRLEMTKKACQGNPRFEVSDLEIHSEGPSYTVNTLAVLSRDRGCEPFFILGTDSLQELHTWKDYERLFTLSHFISVTRPGIEFLAAWNELPERVRSRFRYSGDSFVHESGHAVIPSRVKGLDVSSTQVRNLLHDGRSVRYLIPEEVRMYIQEKKLYGK